MREFQDIEESFEAVEESPAAEGLRAAVDHGEGQGGAGVGEVDSEKLEQEAARHRVLLMRGGAVIAVTTVISIVGALFIHGVFAGVFVLGMFFHWGATQGGGGHGDAALAEGKGNDEIMVVDDGEPERPVRAALGNPANVAARGVVAAFPQLPQLPVGAEQVVVPQVTLPQVAEAPVAPPVDLGTVKGAVPVNMSSTTVVPESVVVAPPTAAASPTAVASAAGARGNAAGQVAGGEDGDDEPTMHLYTNGAGGAKGSGSGSGTSRGAGRGKGVDRGASGADRPEPVVLDDPQPTDGEVPPWLRYDPPKKRVTFNVMVLETGKVGEITVTESSGRAEVDAFYRGLLMQWKYSPAIEGGKPVARIKEISFDPRI